MKIKQLEWIEDKDILISYRAHKADCIFFELYIYSASGIGDETMKIWDLGISPKIEHLFPYGGGSKNMSSLQKGRNLTFEECKIVAQEYLIELFEYFVEEKARGTARITTEMG